MISMALQLRRATTIMVFKHPAINENDGLINHLAGAVDQTLCGEVVKYSFQYDIDDPEHQYNIEGTELTCTHCINKLQHYSTLL